MRLGDHFYCRSDGRAPRLMRHFLAMARPVPALTPGVQASASPRCLEARARLALGLRAPRSGTQRAAVALESITAGADLERRRAGRQRTDQGADNDHGPRRETGGIGRAGGVVRWSSVFHWGVCALQGGPKRQLRSTPVPAPQQGATPAASAPRLSGRRSSRPVVISPGASVTPTRLLAPWLLAPGGAGGSGAQLGRWRQITL